MSEDTAQFYVMYRMNAFPMGESISIKLKEVIGY